MKGEREREREGKEERRRADSRVRGWEGGTYQQGGVEGERWRWRWREVNRERKRDNKKKENKSCCGVVELWLLELSK